MEGEGAEAAPGEGFIERSSGTDCTGRGGHQVPEVVTVAGPVGVARDAEVRRESKSAGGSSRDVACARAACRAVSSLRSNRSLACRAFNSHGGQILIK